ncbi:MAG: chloride channel protein [Deltaproteobacteria bacterium]|nr:chloride channel protein [Deltaproteobacteria bacterium]
MILLHTFRRWLRLVGNVWSRKMETPLRRLRDNEHIFLVISAIMLGIFAAYGAIAFRYLILWSTSFFHPADGGLLGAIGLGRHWAMLLVPMIGGLIVGMVVFKIAPEVKGSGIPEVMEAVAKKGGAIRWRVVLTKAIAAAVTIGSGGSAGREGPIVHIGATIGSVLGQILQASVRNIRTFVACGAAAAIAATFNAPIAGALFAIEVVLGDMRVASMSPIVIASVVATVVSRHYLGDFPAFEVPAFTLVSYREMILYAVVGIVSGLFSVAFIRVLYWFSERFDGLNVVPWLKPAIGGLAVGAIGLVVPNVFGVGYETINSALNGDSITIANWSGWPVLLIVMFAKMLATSFTLGSGGSGGVFAPSLFVGAVLGAAFGSVVNIIFPEWTAPASAYALVGMGAVVSSTTHAPITAILIIFELTNNYKIIPPLMLACVIGVLLSSYLRADSIYTEKLTRRGVKMSRGRDLNLLKAIPVSAVMDTHIQSVSADTPVTVLFKLLTGGQKPTAVVVDAQDRYVGTVELQDVREVLHESEELAFVVVAADVADRTTSAVYPDERLDYVMQLFGNMHRDELPVCTSREDPVVVGTITRKAVIDAYNARIFAEDMTDGLSNQLNLVHRGRMVEMIPGIFISEIEVPARWVGKRLKELDLRKETEIDILLLQRYSEDGARGDSVSNSMDEIRPYAELVFVHGDRVLVMGPKEAIFALMK